jgi:hypothetical protein
MPGTHRWSIQILLAISYVAINTSQKEIAAMKELAYGGMGYL